MWMPKAAASLFNLLSQYSGITSIKLVSVAPRKNPFKIKIVSSLIHSWLSAKAVEKYDLN